jgi:hypothetical protein
MKTNYIDEKAFYLENLYRNKVAIQRLAANNSSPLFFIEIKQLFAIFLLFYFYYNQFLLTSWTSSHHTCIYIDYSYLNGRRTNLYKGNQANIKAA